MTNLLDLKLSEEILELIYDQCRYWHEHENELLRANFANLGASVAMKIRDAKRERSKFARELAYTILHSPKCTRGQGDTVEGCTCKDCTLAMLGQIIAEETQ